jgi:hypothetical protein
MNQAPHHWPSHVRQYGRIFYCPDADKFIVKNMLGRSFSTLERAIAARNERDGVNKDA